MSKFLATSRKAVAAAVAAGAAVSPSVASIDNEFIRVGAVVGAAAVAFAMVWFTPNRPSDAA